MRTDALARIHRLQQIGGTLDRRRALDALEAHAQTLDRFSAVLEAAAVLDELEALAAVALPCVSASVN
jgi:hypothetical protein